MQNFFRGEKLKVFIAVVLMTIATVFFVYNAKNQIVAEAAGLSPGSPSPKLEDIQQNQINQTEQAAPVLSVKSVQPQPPASVPVSTSNATPVQTFMPVPAPTSATAQSCSDSDDLTASLISSGTTPSQYILASAAGGTSQITYDFASSDGDTTLNRIDFTVTDNDKNSSNTVTQICMDSFCAYAGSGEASMQLPDIVVPSGGGITKNLQVQYSGIDTIGQMISPLVPGMAPRINLTGIEYTRPSSVGTLPCSLSAPVMTLVGSMPTVAVPSNGTPGLVINLESQIGSVSVAATNDGNVEVRQVEFYIGNSGFSSAPTISDPYISMDGNNAPISGSSCIVNGNIITCTLGSSYDTDFVIPAGQTQTFNLFGVVSGTVSPGSTASISSSLSASGFIWDDTSANGTPGSGLAGSLIYGFPINAWQTHQ